MAAWNSLGLEVAYYVLGWIAFCSWAICFYPQLILNFRRKSVVGLNFDFVGLNLTKHISYLIYNASLFFSSSVQRQYHQKYGFDQMIPVAANDVAFSIYAVLLAALTLFQIVIYDDKGSGLLTGSRNQRGNQKISKIAIIVISLAWVSAAVCVFVALPTHSWYWVVSCFNTLQVVMTTIKYLPQAIFNFQRKSTIGFSIGYVLLDFLGSTMNFCQMMMQSLDQGSLVNLYANAGKTLLSFVCIWFDVVFTIQHFLLYPPSKRATASSIVDAVSTEPLLLQHQDQDDA